MINKIVILGGAESGVGAAVLAKKQGFEKHYLWAPKIASVPHIYKCVRKIPRGTLRTLH